ncbi:uncharacterized protein TRIADDRAFT_57303 [Trichoplax adhaerens]|uniref:Uncharacterized protein n=1 Tax=Trichoplax adhaerens TaxID=10228 RepID=B3RZ26_TRIAD|nr:predicted protein [Trichoplax adhaerens]EDV24129.1 predicted protein [Trichoplax adhaerens]|eukprot:XP_002113655.1 predicted protein [Trichoplax adhaerens]
MVKPQAFSDTTLEAETTFIDNQDAKLTNHNKDDAGSLVSGSSGNLNDVLNVVYGTSSEDTQGDSPCGPLVDYDKLDDKNTSSDAVGFDNLGLEVEAESTQLVDYDKLDHKTTNSGAGGFDNPGLEVEVKSTQNATHNLETTVSDYDAPLQSCDKPPTTGEDHSPFGSGPGPFENDPIENDTEDLFSTAYVNQAFDIGPESANVNDKREDNDVKQNQIKDSPLSAKKQPVEEADTTSKDIPSAQTESNKQADHKDESDEDHHSDSSSVASSSSGNYDDIFHAIYGRKQNQVGAENYQEKNSPGDDGSDE